MESCKTADSLDNKMEEITSPESECMKVDTEGGSTVHLLPCSIAHNGPAPIKSFFLIKEEKDGTKISHIRGRELKGKTVTLPPQVVGLCVTQRANGDKGVASAHAGKVWTAENHFNSLTVWQHDLSPDLQFIEDSMDWFQIAANVHAI